MGSPIEPTPAGLEDVDGRANGNSLSVQRPGSTTVGQQRHNDNDIAVSSLRDDPQGSGVVRSAFGLVIMMSEFDVCSHMRKLKTLMDFSRRNHRHCCQGT